MVSGSAMGSEATPSWDAGTFPAVSLSCSWCGVGVADDEGFRAAEPAGERVAAFCRLEHIVPWVIQGAHWDAGTLPGVDPDNGYGLGRCAHCTAQLTDTYVL